MDLFWGWESLSFTGRITSATFLFLCWGAEPRASELPTHTTEPHLQPLILIFCAFAFKLFFFPPVRMFQKSSSKTFLRFWMDIDLVFQHPFSVYFLSGPHLSASTQVGRGEAPNLGLSSLELWQSDLYPRLPSHMRRPC